ncbi:unnamed protein product [Amoebophrya sp. A25]|nr:unnamed protein product [Amoebophrya sp. A25]|eukprot:GSA25T00004909001.1
MNDHPSCPWSVLALRCGGPARHREHKVRRHMDMDLVQRKTAALQRVSSAISDFERRERLEDDSVASVGQEGVLAVGGGLHGHGDEEHHEQAEAATTGSADDRDEAQRQRKKFIPRRNSDCAFYDYGAISGKAATLWRHVIKHNRHRDLDRGELYNSHRRIYTNNPLPGMSPSSWNRQEAILLPKELKYKSPSIVPNKERASLGLIHMLNPVCWAKYRDLTGKARCHLQQTGRDLSGRLVAHDGLSLSPSLNSSMPLTTRSVELKRLKTAKNLDKTAAEEILISRRQYQAHKWGRALEPWRDYDPIPKGCAPASRICTENKMSSIASLPTSLTGAATRCERLGVSHLAECAFRDAHEHSGLDMHLERNKDQMDMTGSGMEQKMLMTNSTTASSSFLDQDGGQVTLAAPLPSGGSINARDANTTIWNTSPKIVGTGVTTTFVGDKNIVADDDDDVLPARTTRNYFLPRPHALRRPWHEREEERIVEEERAAAKKTMKTMRSKDDVVVQIPDFPSAVVPRYRWIFEKLFHMTRLRKTSVVKFFKDVTRKENQAHGLVPAERFHAALHKLLVVPQHWPLRQSLELVYYIRKFEWRVDGGCADDGMIDLWLLDRLVDEIGRENARDQQAFESALQKAGEPDHSGKMLKFTEDLLAKRNAKLYGRKIPSRSPTLPTLLGESF